MRTAPAAFAATAAVLLLALTGCTGTPDAGADQPSQQGTPGVDASATRPGAAPEAETTPARTPEEEKFLAPRTTTAVFDHLADLTDDEFLALGYKVCENAEAGIAWTENAVLPDLPPEHYPLNGTIQADATRLLCPDAYSPEDYAPED